MKENVLFILPDTLEEVIWALPPISQYLENRLVMTEAQRDSRIGFVIPARNPIGRVAVVCPLAEIHHFIESCWSKIEVTTEVMDEQKEMADLVIELNPALAYRLTLGVKKHITEAYGIMIGAVPMMILPAIAMPIVREESGSVLVVGRHHLDSQRDWKWEHEEEFVRMGVEGGLPVKTISEEASYDELARAVARASVVIGVRSTGTLLAAAFRKVVMELNPEGFEHKEWMSKWENKAYRMIYGDLQDMTAWFVWDRTHKLVAEISKMRGPELWADHQSATLAEASAIVGA